MVESLNISEKHGASNIKLLKAATEPFTQYIIRIDTSVIAKIAANQTSAHTSMIKTSCDDNADTKCKYQDNNKICNILHFY